jgi:hypothetical protein
VVAVVDWQDMDAFLSLSTQVFQQLMALLAVVKEFHHLFERNCDEQADDDGCNVDKEASPRVNWFMKSVYIKHRR